MDSANSASSCFSASSSSLANSSSNSCSAAASELIPRAVVREGVAVDGAREGSRMRDWVEKGEEARKVDREALAAQPAGLSNCVAYARCSRRIISTKDRNGEEREIKIQNIWNSSPALQPTTFIPDLDAEPRRNTAECVID